MSDFECRVSETERLLLESCEQWQIAVAGDRSVVEGDAERLLGYRPGALRAQRDNGTCRIPRRRIGNRWRYRLVDLAHEIESGYDCA
jgi:hypothetical protein